MPLPLEAFIAMRDLRVSLHPPQLSHQMIMPISKDGEKDSPRPSLLDLPYEIRAIILRYVLQAQPHLSSIQELRVTEREESYRSISEHFSPISRFNCPSVSFKQYPHSRHADTSILYTCRQLRSEGIHLWYHYNYYLTFLLEVQPVSNSKHTSDDPLPPTLIYQPCSKPHIHQFWTHIHHLFRWPSYSTIRKFKSLHISLFLEERIFKYLTDPPNIQANLPSPDPDNDGASLEENNEIQPNARRQTIEEEQADPTPITSNEIISILLGNPSHGDSDTSPPLQAQDPSLNNDSASLNATSQPSLSPSASSSTLTVHFKDHSFLGLTKNANDHNFSTRFQMYFHTTTRDISDKDDEHTASAENGDRDMNENTNGDEDEDEQPNLTFCLELWRS